MKSIFFTFLIFFPLALVAQTNSDILLQEGTKWIEGPLDTYLYTFRSQIEYEVKGDSLIKGYKYKKIYANDQVYALLREDKLKKVYIYHKNPDTEEYNDLLLYSFGSWNIGDSISYSDHYSALTSEPVSKIIKKENLTSVCLKDGKEYKRYEDFPIDIIQGIGNVGKGPLGVLRHEVDNGTRWAFIGIYNNNQLLYENTQLLNRLETRLVTEGIHWTERHSIENDPENPDPFSRNYELIQFQITGDTLINGHIYKKVYRNESYYMGLREEDPVTIWRTEGEKEYLLYKFDWFGSYNHFGNYTGETFTFPHESPERILLNGIQYITCKVPYNPDKSADPFRTHNKDIRLILNIGLTSGIFSHIQPVRDCYCFNDLVCFYIGDRLIYQNPVFTETGEVLSIDTPRKEGNLSVLVSGNEVVFTLKNLSGKHHTILKVYTPEGVQVAAYSLQTGAVIANNLSGGVYLYSLVNGNEKIETGKFIIGN